MTSNKNNRARSNNRGELALYLVTLSLSISVSVPLFALLPGSIAQAAHAETADTITTDDRATDSAPERSTQTPLLTSSSGAAPETRSEAKADSASEQETREQVVTLTDLHEVGLALQRIKQQARNIYVEATRTPTTCSSPIEINDPRTIPVKQTGTDYLAPRREWLVYYMSSMEPIIQLLANDVKDSRSGAVKIVAPEAAKDCFELLKEKWEHDVLQMNNHLSDLLALFDDAPKNNIPIADSAVTIFEDAEHLEELRRAAYKLVLRAEKHPNKTATVKPPKH